MIIYENNVAGHAHAADTGPEQLLHPRCPGHQEPYGLTTWFDGPPYMLPANVAMSSECKLSASDDVQFQSLSLAVNPQTIERASTWCPSRSGVVRRLTAYS